MLQSMTIGELIAELSQYDEDLEVRIAQPTQNYWHEVQCTKIDVVEEACMRLNDANTTCPNKLLIEAEDDCDEPHEPIILIS